MTPEIEALIATATRLLEGLAGQQAMTDDRWRQEWTDALAALRAQPDEVARHRRACECAEPDPVMQADRKFYCYRCSFETGARPPMLELESEVARLTALVGTLETALSRAETTGIDRAAFDAVCEERDRLEVDMDWRPIATFSKSTLCALLTDGGDVTVGGWVSADEEAGSGEGWWFANVIDMQPTHWMPLPAPPEGPTR